MITALVIEIVEGSFGYGPQARMFRATVKCGRAVSPRAKWTDSPADFEFSPAAEFTIADALESAAREAIAKLTGHNS